jgi:hypothetical protein
MRFLLVTASLASLAIATLSGQARASDGSLAPASSRPHTYAVVIGSNTGGAGQAPLRFAEDDAQRVAAVLRDLGHYAASDVHVLLHPDASHVAGAIDELASKVRANAASGEQSEVVFYYSGHARASGLTLGSEEVPLDRLRGRLSALPSTLTIVVLDACQSGAFARVKGAEPAADFSYNSVSRLTQKGLAVVASSTSQELSQESDELKASYFTHHFVTALRGAGDADGDGRVSLDEAYRYAYRRTLASTARTQVGGQHVTLETDLAGQGDVPVTYPAEARAQLEIPGPMEARVLVQHRASGAIVAELEKTVGAPIRLALVAGAYEAIVARPSGIVQCRFALVDDQVTPLDTASCTTVPIDRTSSKGEGTEHDLRERDRWEIEAAAGFIWRQTDGYTQTLQEFGYQRQAGLFDLPTARLTLGASRILAPHVAGVLQVATLAGDTYARSIGNSSDQASFSAYSAALYVRASTDLLGPWFGVYAQVGGGMSLGFLDYQTKQTDVPPSSTGTYVGYVLGGAGGMTLRFRRFATLFAQAGFDHAPAIRNLIGDTHDSGGPSVVFGLRVRLGDPQP